MRHADRRPHDTLHSACALVAAFILLCVAAGCGRIQHADPTTQDKYKVTLAIVPSPAVVGPGALAVTLRDQAGQPVDGARLQVEANMTHAGMVPLLASVAQSEAGVYRVPLEWSMAGDWYVDLTFTLPDGQRVARRYPVQVR
jgi:YtkA-like